MSSESQNTQTRINDPKADWDSATPEQRREIIVDVAISILNEKDISHVTIRRVASQIGVGAMTLYTYVDGQQGLRTAILDRGFEIMDSHCDCDEHPKMNNHESWVEGCTNYVEFAVHYPNLYTLMFTHPLDQHELANIQSHFERWRHDVHEYYSELGIKEEDMQPYVERTTRDCWVAMHGLASLIISQRLQLNEQEIRQQIETLIERLYIEPGQINE
ncbi:hypothetical protein KS4_10360 [Poriferisphaera corsica]|uniref:HTH tetR-type domain-containing protein n=1 Tax=Poriferisphaera corsica TaxID=2528020 RepID=A0A517YRZ0_9BACT|nr:TetR/AcrR family transcriptional regulator [Poriferisphaera corsica]QDU32997.1 hypothetical protein KS4_10360 [Poriferisphaera corsica]